MIRNFKSEQKKDIKKQYTQQQQKQLTKWAQHFYLRNDIKIEDCIEQILQKKQFKKGIVYIRNFQLIAKVQRTVKNMKQMPYMMVKRSKIQSKQQKDNAINEFIKSQFKIILTDTEHLICDQAIDLIINDTLPLRDQYILRSAKQQLISNSKGTVISFQTQKTQHMSKQQKFTKIKNSMATQLQIVNFQQLIQKMNIQLKQQQSPISSKNPISAKRNRINVNQKQQQEKKVQSNLIQFNSDSRRNSFKNKNKLEDSRINNAPRPQSPTFNEVKKENQEKLYDLSGSRHKMLSDFDNNQKISIKSEVKLDENSNNFSSYQKKQNESQQKSENVQKLFNQILKQIGQIKKKSNIQNQILDFQNRYSRLEEKIENQCKKITENTKLMLSQINRRQNINNSSQILKKLQLLDQKIQNSFTKLSKSSSLISNQKQLNQETNFDIIKQKIIKQEMKSSKQKQDLIDKQQIRISQLQASIKKKESKEADYNEKIAQLQSTISNLKNEIFESKEKDKNSRGRNQYYPSVDKYKQNPYQNKPGSNKNIVSNDSGIQKEEHQQIINFVTSLNKMLKNSFQLPFSVELSNYKQKIPELSSYFQIYAKKNNILSESQIYSQMKVSQKAFLLQSLKGSTENITYTKTVFIGTTEYSFENWHKILSNKQNILVLMKLANGVVIGGYTVDPVISDQQSLGKKGDAFLFSTNSMKKYDLSYYKRGFATRRDKYFIIFGNDELSIRPYMKFSMIIGMHQCYFNTKGETAKKFLAQQKDEGDYVRVQFHQCFTKQKPE